MPSSWLKRTLDGCPPNARAATFYWFACPVIRTSSSALGLSSSPFNRATRTPIALARRNATGAGSFTFWGGYVERLMSGDGGEELRAHWQRLQRCRLSPEDVFDDPAQRRIGSSIATGAVSAPQRVISLKHSRRTEAYYLLQAADAQDRAQRAHSPADREAWSRLAHNWLALLKNTRALREHETRRVVGGQHVAKRFQ
jgi:hypothetical protein